MTQLRERGAAATAAAPRSTACAHCGLPVPADLVDPAGGESFCCNGCRTVYATLRDLGLDGYYGVRDALRGRSEVEPARTSGNDYAVFDRESFTASNVAPLPGGLAQVEFLLEGVHCPACVWLVERLPRAQDGVVEARLRLSDAVARVIYDPTRAKPSDVARSLDRIGYPPHPVSGTERREVDRRADRARLVRLGVAGACAGNVMLLAFALYAGRENGMEHAYQQFFRWTSLVIAAISFLWPGREFFRGALAALRTRTGNLDVPISLALLAGGVAGTINTVRGSGEIYFDSLSVLVFLLLVGRYVQQRQQRYARDAVDLTRSLVPISCRVRRGDASVEVAVSELEPGDLVEVASGGLVPADGEVVEGEALVDQALLTGESEPVRVTVGDTVHAGTRSDGAPLLVRATAVGPNSRVGRLMEIVERGLAEKPPILRLTDRIAGWFVLVLSILATGTFAVWWSAAGLGPAVEHTVALLIVACPCALGLATPLTLAVAVGRAARRGLLVKDAAARAARARCRGRARQDGHTDERATGTAEWVGTRARSSSSPRSSRDRTTPRKALCAVSTRRRATSPRSRRSTTEASRVASARGASPSVHRATSRSADRRGGPVSKAERGARGGGQHRRRGRGGRAAPVVAVAALLDRPRADAASSIEGLRRAGFATEILSGDAAGPVRRVASLLGFAEDDARGGVDPEGKLQRVRTLRARGESIVMVGDGVNDAAALAAADVGIAVHGGAETSLAAADVFASKPGLEPLLDLVALARRTLLTIRLNLGLSLGYNLVVGLLAMTGHVDALVAAIVMPISSATVLTVALGSLSRPLRRERPRTRVVARVGAAEEMSVPCP
ncbi:MAG: heavy metal translocating P-type ATPase [Planctomycetota bacterium]